MDLIKCEKNSYADVRKSIEADGIKRWGSSGHSRIVFTNGCFDLLHPGHIRTLAFAAAHAGPRGAVVVAINSDKSIERLKGPRRPIMPEVARATVLSALRCVDYVVTFDEDTPIEIIKAIRPDIIVKGGDYDPKEVVGRDEAVVMTAPYDDTWSTTKIVERITKDAVEEYESTLVYIP